jgi:hypothetical protein
VKDPRHTNGSCGLRISAGTIGQYLNQPSLSLRLLLD